MNTKPRHELKYLISAQDASVLKSRLSPVLPKDKNSEDDSGYLVTSLYYDTFDFAFAREKEDGLGERVKYRIRTYGNEGASFRLERKAKSGSLCFKTSCSLETPWSENTKAPFGAFFAHRRTGVLKPAVIVRYRRKAYCTEPGNIRFTFDEDLTALRPASGFPQNTGMAVPVFPDRMAILEIKFDDFLPSSIGSLVRMYARPALSLSKYLLCLKATGVW